MDFDVKQHELLQRLVENAMDFLSQSIREFDEQPKYSVIHFHAAVELFLKARLFAEHWSLVVSKRKDADWDDFVAGKFISVSLDEAARKLDKIVRTGLTKQELETFRRLTTHRNKMVHFFHEGVSDEKNDELRSVIAKEQLTAWYLLHKLLTLKWSEQFSAWTRRLSEIDKSLRRLHQFLQVVFDQVRAEIGKRKENGAAFGDCPSCGFPSQEHLDEIDVIYEAECLVCGLTDRCLMIECPVCGVPVQFANEGFGACGNCETRFEPENVADALADERATYTAVKEGDDTWNPGNCSDCDGYHTVVRLSEDGDSWICASCFGEFDSMAFCGWCNELNTGGMEDSYWAGCSVCDGKHGRYRD